MLFKVVILLAAVTAVHAQLIIPDCANASDYKFLYANTGGDFSTPILTVNVACLGPGPCDFVYSSAVCAGCFTPCTERRVIFTNVAEGSVQTIDIATQAFALGDVGVQDGDLICSTKQLAVAGRPSTSDLSEAAEWSGSALAGTQFTFVTNRANAASCNVFAFDADTSVDFIPNGGSSNPVNVPAYTFRRFPLSGTFNAQNDEAIFTSDHPILVSCWENANDFQNVVPITNAPIYGKKSKGVRIAASSCADLSPITEAGNLSCVNSNDGVETISTISGNVFRIGSNDNGPGFFAGESIRCEPTLDTTCLSAFTTGDGNGGEAVTWMSAAHFSDYFVSPYPCDQISITSDVDTECTLDGTTSMLVDATSGSPQVFDFYLTATSPAFSVGSIITCNDPVMIIASHDDDEFTLYGRFNESQITFFPEVTCSPTASPTTAIPSTNPTPSPSNSPSESPTLFPTLTPTKSPTPPPTIDAALVGGLSGGALVACAAIVFAYGAFRRYQRELAKDEMMLNPDVYIEDEGFGESRDGKGVAEVMGTEQGKMGLMAVISATLSRTGKRKKDEEKGEAGQKADKKEGDASDNKLEEKKESGKSAEELKEEQEKEALLTFAGRQNGSEFEHDIAGML